MISRIDDFFSFFSMDESARKSGMAAAAAAAERAQGMTHLKDYEAMAAIVLHYRPKRIFEIGTYLGITSDFFLLLLPESEVVSIAYQNPRWKILSKIYNNSGLSRDQIGSGVAAERRSRFTQLYGDSHELDSRTLLKEYGPFDLVLIDGDHSAHGVSLDTELAKSIIPESGVICWHDANPKPKYRDVRQFLERELSLPAVATRDDYIGGIGVWSREIEGRLASFIFS